MAVPGKSVLIIGARGLLGRYLLRSRPANLSVTGTSRSADVPQVLEPKVDTVPLELDRSGNVVEVLKALHPTVVVFCAGESRVDTVEGHFEDFYSELVTSVSTVAKWCQEHASHLVYISSNAVFGNSLEPLRSDSPQEPLNDYGRLKAAAELEITGSCEDHAIVRPILMYGWPNPGYRSNPVSFWLERWARSCTTDVAQDVLTQPLYADDCAHVIWRIVEGRLTGSFNVGGLEYMSLLDFAKICAKEFALDPSLIVTMNLAELDLPATRPLSVRFDTDELAGQIGLRPRPVVETFRDMQEERLPKSELL